MGQPSIFRFGTLLVVKVLTDLVIFPPLCWLVGIMLWFSCLHLFHRRSIQMVLFVKESRMVGMGLNAELMQMNRLYYVVVDVMQFYLDCNELVRKTF